MATYYFVHLCHLYIANKISKIAIIVLSVRGGYTNISRGSALYGARPRDVSIEVRGQPAPPGGHVTRTLGYATPRRYAADGQTL